MSRKALVVGINDYGDHNSLKGCVNDAVRMHSLLFRDFDDRVNIHSKLWTAPGVNVAMAKGPNLPARIDKSALHTTLEEFFDDRHCELAVFFFAGHGLVNKLDGYLVTQEAQKYSEGFSMRDLQTLAHGSPIPEIVIVLDCCHSGMMAQWPLMADKVPVVLRDGITVLSACGPSEVARENDGRGVFTNLICDGLDGGAADIQGRVTVASLYAYAEDALGAFEQRPYFRTSVSKLSSLRRCAPAVPHAILDKLPVYFATPSDEYPLDPAYEPDAELNNSEKQKIFGHLQVLRDAHMLIPVGERHLYYAAMRSKACKLTPLGRAYWRLAKESKLWPLNNS